MAIVDQSPARGMPKTLIKTDVARVSVSETGWGYIIRNERAISGDRRLMTLTAGFLAISFAIAAAAIWMAPLHVFSGDVLIQKASGSSLMVIIALLLSRLANADPVVEIQVDCRRGELREVVRRTGDRPRLIGRTAFADIGGLFFDRAGCGRLVARYRNTAHLITVCEGQGPTMERIRDRLARDVMGAPISA